MTVTGAMMPQRPSEMLRFLDLTGRAIVARAAPRGPETRAASKICDALSSITALMPDAVPARLPACEHFAAAIATAKHGPADIAQLADSLVALEPRLTWYQRPGAAQPFKDQHANAMIVGPRGLEQRHDVQIGVSLMAPGSVYPDHRHLPEEVYVVLSPGFWRQESRAWHEPGVGGLVYNPPDIIHAMRAVTAPLLAIWWLWAG